MHRARVDHDRSPLSRVRRGPQQDFLLVSKRTVDEELQRMKSYTKILFSFLATMICTTSFAAEKIECRACADGREK